MTVTALLALAGTLISKGPQLYGAVMTIVEIVKSALGDKRDKLNAAELAEFNDVLDELMARGEADLAGLVAAARAELG